MKSRNVKSRNVKSPEVKSPDVKSPNVKSRNVKSRNVKSTNDKRPNTKVLQEKGPIMTKPNLSTMFRAIFSLPYACNELSGPLYLKLGSAQAKLITTQVESAFYLS